MLFYPITNLNAYVKNLERKTTWDFKQKTGAVTAKNVSLSGESSSSQTQDASSQWQIHHGDEKLTAIHTKIDAGLKLTREEREYLKSKDPAAYQDLVRQEREQKAYEKALRRCKTKEEAKRLQMNYINKSVMVVRSIEHNPHISEQKKLEIAMREKQLVSAAAESMQQFIREGEYAKLPDEAEKQDNKPKKKSTRSSAPEPLPIIDLLSSKEPTFSQSSWEYFPPFPADPTQPQPIEGQDPSSSGSVSNEASPAKPESPSRTLDRKA